MALSKTTEAQWFRFSQCTLQQSCSTRWEGWSWGWSDVTRDEEQCRWASCWGRWHLSLVGGRSWRTFLILRFGWRSSPRIVCDILVGLGRSFWPWCSDFLRIRLVYPLRLPIFNFSRSIFLWFCSLDCLRVKFVCLKWLYKDKRLFIKQFVW